MIRDTVGPKHGAHSGGSHPSRTPQVATLSWQISRDPKLLELRKVGSRLAELVGMSFDELLGPATRPDPPLPSSRRPTSVAQVLPQSRYQAPLVLNQERTFLGMGKQAMPVACDEEQDDLWGDTQPDPPLPLFAIRALRLSLAAKAAPASVPRQAPARRHAPVLRPAFVLWPELVPEPEQLSYVGAVNFSTQELNFFTVGDDLISDATTLRRIKLKWWQRIGIPRRNGR